MSEKSESDDNELSSVYENESSNDSSSRNVNQDEKGNAPKAELAKKESQAVFRLRVLVVLILFLAAIAVSVVVYLITTRAEHDTFVASYEGAAQKITDSFEAILEKIGTISSVGTAATIHGLDRAGVASWPFVTLTSFQQRSATARLLSGALYVTISPLVQDHDLPEWEKYVAGPANDWITEGFAYQDDLDINNFEVNYTDTNGTLLDPATGNQIFYFDESGDPQADIGPGPYLPTWQTSPVLRKQNVNENLFRRSEVADVVSQCVSKRQAILGRFSTAPPGSIDDSNKATSMYATLRSMAEKETVHYLGDPMARLFLPIFDSFETNRTTVAVLMSVIHWRSYLRKILPNNVRGITVVLENSCDGYFSYGITGDEAYVLGFGDHHDRSFNSMQRTATFRINTAIADGTKAGTQLNQEYCQYSLRVYPSKEFYRLYVTSTPLVITFAVAMVFIFTAGMFFVYDHLVERRQRMVLSKATQSAAIVSSLFPKQFHDRLLQMEGERDKAGNILAPTHRLKSFLHGDSNDQDHGLDPIADLFPHCTVLFADIAGFTAWSSTREPEQVFVLLQTVYQAFDILAKRRQVFKVETIGDSYVAVTGLPEPQQNHAVIMVRFAWDCMQRMGELSKDLEVTLGPDTGDLSMRIGLHSGPVTAGVLRGDRARFQLFGDTVNTASRMESTGYRGKIQTSKATADLLTLAGKGHWVKPREDVVEAKGKGVLHTFWANPSSKKESEQDSDGDKAEDASERKRATQINSKPDFDSIKRDRLVDWMVELFVDHIKKIVAKRNAMGVKPRLRSIRYTPPVGSIVLDEVKESITMPKFDARAATGVEDFRAVTISPEILEQIRRYVKSISLTYHENPFHNFEHACHVTMSVNKLLKRIVAPDLNAADLKRVHNSDELASHLHDYTHGINSDPLASLAIVYSAMIHDADHRGVSNAQLIKEDSFLGNMYRNKSVAEQNSVDVAWKLFMQDEYDELRSYIFATESELLRFRQMIVNVVLATDIFDKELNDLRKSRWEKAFHEEHSLRVNDLDLKATIVIEHIIQASDVSHTMQHWHIYRKWNQRLFTELYLAFRAGRMGADPTVFWYKGELGFFDNYIIPLAKKLKECNVFGVSSDEYLNYAVRNRAEWEERGQELVAGMLEEVKKDFGVEEASTD